MWWWINLGLWEEGMKDHTNTLDGLKLPLREIVKIWGGHVLRDTVNHWAFIEHCPFWACDV